MGLLFSSGEANMADHSSVPMNSSKKNMKDTKAKNRNTKLESSEKQAVAVGSFSVDKTFRAFKVKIEKPEDEEKERLSFCPKENRNLMHYLCKHEITKLAGEQGWKFILENIDDKLVVKLFIRNETPIEKCRDKVREFITNSLPHLHQETFDLSPLSSKTHSNSRHGDMESNNQGPDPANKDPLEQALVCL
ncbi:uncharacterized protein LOC117321076, partial [Pecten maximus]|uniref:uncharacterized protein LOC117321076 n=1 Tax=Pecten maximus TaxID=6579 RepID=UPI001458A63C